MSLWSNNGLANGAPKFAVAAGAKDIAVANNTVAGTVNCQAAFQNVSSSVYVQGQQVGVFAVDTAESANTTGEGRSVTHAGWVKRTVGTGGVSSITITNAGGGYSNGWIVFSGGGGVNANASFTVNGSGNITSIIVRDPGHSYNTAPTAIANTSNSVAATLTVVLGGRAGRKTYETLVAMGSMSPGANTDNTYFPD
jgi:hypothetical protein